MMEHAPILIIITPLAGALLLEILSRFDLPESTNDVITLVSLALPVVILFSFAPSILRSPIVYELGGWPRPYGISLVIDSLSATMATITGMVTLSTFAYSLEAKDMLPRGERYYFLFLFMTTGLYGVFLTGDIINRYIFFELTVLTTYVLLTYTGGEKSLKASYYYLIIGSVASFLFLAGIALLYFYTGFLDLKALAGVVPTLSSEKTLMIFSFFFVAVGIKSGLIPFHSWLPDAHVSAPTPMTAVLAGITVKTGAYILIKLMMIGFFNSFIQTLMIVVGLLSGILGVLLTFTYWDLKRILAWHTISQMGIIVASLSLWTPLSVASSLYQLINHAIFKTLLFLSAGAFIFIYETRDIRELPLQNGNVIIVTSFLVGLLSLASIPPFNGFYSKSMMITAAINRPVISFLFIMIQILTVTSIFRIIYYSIETEVDIHPPISHMKTITILAGLCIFMGATSTIWIKNVILPAGAIITGTPGLAEGGYVEIKTLTTIGGMVVMATVPLGVLLFPSIKRLDMRPVRRWLTDISITDAVRFILFVQALVLLFTFLF